MLIGTGDSWELPSLGAGVGGAREMTRSQLNAEWTRANPNPGFAVLVEYRFASGIRYPKIEGHGICAEKNKIECDGGFRREWHWAVYDDADDVVARF